MELLTPSLGLLFWTFLIPFVFWLIALIDILRSEFKGPNDKLIWVLVILFVPILGPILYLVIGRKNKVNLNQY
jgi:hypothetical protein